MADIYGHYVPKFYLKGFTKTGVEDGRLFVFTNDKHWLGSPKNDAREGGMYTDAVENAFAKVENDFAPMLKEILETRQLPSIQQSYIIDFIASTALRGRVWRRMLHDAASDMNKIALKNLESPDTRKRFEYFKQIVPQSDGLKFEHYEAAVRDGNYFIPSRDEYVRAMTDSMTPVFNNLHKRTWILQSCDDDAPDLICSDHPVAIAESDGTRSPKHVGFESLNTVLMPLSRRMLLVGRIANPHHFRFPRTTLNRAQVALVNAVIRTDAEQSYSSEDEYIFTDSTGAIQTEKHHLVSRKQKTP